MSDVREDFEQWQAESGRTDPQWLALHENGKYGLTGVQDEWEIWEAAAKYYKAEK